MRVLVANFFPAFHPPRSGGEQRYYYLYHYLSRHFDVTLLSPTYSDDALEIVDFSPTFREHRVPKESVFDALHWTLGARGIGRECSAYVVALAAAAERRYGERFAMLVENADLIIHECPFTLPYDRSLGTDAKPRFYNAYNVEAVLASQIMTGEEGVKAVGFIRFLEQSLVDCAEKIFVTSEEERVTFASDFGARNRDIVLVPNGFEPVNNAREAAGASQDVADAPFVCFMGSAHPPNIEAAGFIVTLASGMSHVEFRMMGAVCDHLPATRPANVRSLGFVDDAEKRRQLSGCLVALNPLFSGAGTNLKMLDYMAAGAPVVATMIGARGLGLTDKLDVRIAEPPDFATVLREMLGDPGTARAIGEAGKRKAFAEYTWERIAEAARAAIEAVRPGAYGSVPSSGEAGRGRGSILVLNDYPVAQATGGGQVRIRELLLQLSREFNIRLLCFAQGTESTRTRIAPGFEQICVAKTLEHRDAELRAGRGASVSVSDLVSSEYCTLNAELVELFRESVQHAAAVVFEHPYMSPLFELVPKTTPIVYSLHNMEAELKGETLKPRADFQARLSQVAALEEQALRCASLVISVSRQDMETVAKRFPRQRFAVIENGAAGVGRYRAASPSKEERKALASQILAVFIGSSHSPNIEAARFILEALAPALPRVRFLLVGSVCDAIGSAMVPRNVSLLGILEENEKNALLARASIAVNPMFSGGGSSLKVPDFFAAGLALVSTHVGIRGYDVHAGEHYVEADRASFAEAVGMLSENYALRESISAKARAYAAAKLSWPALGASYRRVLRTMIVRGRKRLLVVTYRFADPPPGGAESYLVNMLRELSRRAVFDIDVATCDVGEIRNKWHFTADYEIPLGRPACPPYLHDVLRFAVDEPDAQTLNWCTTLFRMWMVESRSQATRLTLEYPRPVLLGGWNFPEQQAGRASRWASCEAQIHVGAGASELRLSGYAPVKMRIDIVSRDSLIDSVHAGGAWQRTVAIPAGATVIVLRTDERFQASGDPRELAFVLHEATVRGAGGDQSLDLNEDFGAVARTLVPEQWVDSLLAIAESREPAHDRLFCKARGPHSADLKQWLTENAASYDVILAQGTPFSTIIDASHAAIHSDTPIVLLPHFHMEDRYYHWREYYDAFRSAATVIAAPKKLDELVLKPLGARAAIAPGGGIRLDEYSPASMLEGASRFRSLHPSQRPFVLVLGRKAGGKNYQAVIEAVQHVNASVHRVDVVLIGPDEDQVPISAPNACYYGAQPRAVVLGALSLAVCLVNMSVSESFGIVLLESWLAGRPVIAQRKCMAFADLVEHEGNGLLAESVADVARGIERYLGDAGLAHAHAEAGKRLALEYSWSNVAASIEAILLAAIPPVPDREPSPPQPVEESMLIGDDH